MHELASCFCPYQLYPYDTLCTYEVKQLKLLGFFCVGIYFGAPSWRSGRDSNPRAAQHGHTISSRARYDRFDTTPDICRHN